MCGNMKLRVLIFFIGFVVFDSSVTGTDKSITMLLHSQDVVNMHADSFLMYYKNILID